MMNRQEMIEALHSRECRVIFTKVNGEERDMICTLQESILPEAKKDEPLTQKKVRAVNEETVVAWDVNKAAFRSFRVDNVVSYT